LRLWPGASSIQGIITAMFDIAHKHKIDPAQVKTLRIALSQPVFDLHGNFARYTAKFEAMLSAHYVAAAIMHDRELALAQFDPARYDDPNLRRFAERVEVRAASDLRGVAAVVEVETLDGQSCSAHCEQPLGAPENRLSRAQIEAKFRTYAAERLSPSRIEEIIAAVVLLEHQGSVRTLIELLRAAPQRADTPPAPAAAFARG
jgi:2-methylcitrate dehydratase PrpD